MTYLLYSNRPIGHIDNISVHYYIINIFHCVTTKEHPGYWQQIQIQYRNMSDNIHFILINIVDNMHIFQ